MAQSADPEFQTESAVEVGADQPVSMACGWAATRRLGQDNAFIASRETFILAHTKRKKSVVPQTSSHTAQRPAYAAIVSIAEVSFKSTSIVDPHTVAATQTQAIEVRQACIIPAGAIHIQPSSAVET